jgi:hypothetical protein
VSIKAQGWTQKARPTSGFVPLPFQGSSFEILSRLPHFMGFALTQKKSGLNGNLSLRPEVAAFSK